ncbi:extracellular solute-binding protein [Sorangium sp. So ce887]|uniref:extracellular solute-binding protein n=1 Tax=Sorangium sp. So ce887 TaxID=3133324 RepID=UPI003F5FC5CD
MTQGRITILSWQGGWGRALRQAVSEPFERELGVRVEHVPHVGLKLPAALTSALERNERPSVDLMWSNSVPALRAAMRGDCVPLDPAEMPVLAELTGRARPAPAFGGVSSLSVVHPYVVYYVLVYHEEAFPDGAPTSWRVLEEPRHRGKIMLYPGGNGFYPIAQVLGGGRLENIPGDMDACWSFIRRLRPQVQELDFSVGVEERLRRREIELCFRALTNALAFRAAGAPVGWCVPEEGTTDTVDALWIPRGVPDEQIELAKRYISFALRADIQEDWCERLGAMPVHPGAAIPTALRGRTDLPCSSEDHRGLLHIGEHLKVACEHEWEARFAGIFAEA